jgi:protease-4
VLVELRGPIVETRELWTPEGATTLREWADDLGKLARSSEVRRVVVRIGGLGVGATAGFELAAALRSLREAHKRVSCFLDEGGMVEYLVASTCDRVALSPVGLLDVVGVAVEPLFVRRLLERWGVQGDFEQVGRYKGAAEPLQRTSLSPEQREAVTALVERVATAYVQSIAAGRRVDAATVQGWLDSGPYDAPRALAAGLVDSVAFEDEWRAVELSDGASSPQAAPQPGHLSVLPLSDWLGRTGRSTGAPDGTLLELLRPRRAARATGKRIALVYAVGPIVSRGGTMGLGAPVVDAEALAPVLEQLERDPDIRAVVLRIDSPGGSAAASDRLWRRIALLSRRKPVVASLGAVAASGGYYIATAARTILATSTTVTGSIGVIGGKLVLRGLMERLGVDLDGISRGAHAQWMTPSRPFTADERRLFRGLLETVYEQFLQRVAVGRQITPTAVAAAASGRVWSGTAALRLGLVDRLGGLSDALREARIQAGLGEEAAVEVFPRPAGLTQLLQRLAGGAVVGGLPGPASWRTMEPQGAPLELLLGAYSAVLRAWPALATERVWLLPGWLPRF